MLHGMRHKLHLQRIQGHVCKAACGLVNVYLSLCRLCFLPIACSEQSNLPSQQLHILRRGCVWIVCVWEGCFCLACYWASFKPADTMCALCHTVSNYQSSNGTHQSTAISMCMTCERQLSMYCLHCYVRLESAHFQITHMHSRLLISRLVISVLVISRLVISRLVISRQSRSKSEIPEAVNRQDADFLLKSPNTIIVQQHPCPVLSCDSCFGIIGLLLNPAHAALSNAAHPQWSAHRTVSVWHAADASHILSRHTATSVWAARNVAITALQSLKVKRCWHVAEVLHYLETAYGVVTDSPEDKESLAGQNSDLDIGGEPSQPGFDPSDPPRTPSRAGSEPPRPPSRGPADPPRPPSRCCYLSFSNGYLLSLQFRLLPFFAHPHMHSI